jgi:hypothetical protein
MSGRSRDSPKRMHKLGRTAVASSARSPVRSSPASAPSRCRGWANFAQSPSMSGSRLSPAGIRLIAMSIDASVSSRLSQALRRRSERTSTSTAAQGSRDLGDRTHPVNGIAAGTTELKLTGEAPISLCKRSPNPLCALATCEPPHARTTVPRPTPRNSARKGAIDARATVVSSQPAATTTLANRAGDCRGLS